MDEQQPTKPDPDEPVVPRDPADIPLNDGAYSADAIVLGAFDVVPLDQPREPRDAWLGATRVESLMQRSSPVQRGGGSRNRRPPKQESRLCGGPCETCALKCAKRRGHEDDRHYCASCKEDRTEHAQGRVSPKVREVLYSDPKTSVGALLEAVGQLCIQAGSPSRALDILNGLTKDAAA